MRITSRRPAIDSYDVDRVRIASVRTRLVEIALAATAIALLALAALSARGRDVAEGTLLRGSTSVVVIDLSLSISAQDYDKIRRTIRRVIADRSRVGLVIFSDVAYELVPPGTPASALRPLLRLLARRGKRLLPTPWSGTFSAGTQISSALELARDMLVRDRVENGSILLLSDLITAPDDVPDLARTLHALRRESIPVRVVTLTPLRDGETIFRGLLGKRAFVAPSELARRAHPLTTTRIELPARFMLLAALVLGILAAHERLTARLLLPRSHGSHA